MDKLRYYFPGATLILMSILILAVPQILVAIVAASLCMLGLLALSVGHWMRKAERRYEGFRRVAFDDVFWGGGPFGRSWYW